MKVFLSAADASGDLHAAALLSALREREPQVRAYGLGGPHLEAAGLEPRVRHADLAVAGLVEVLAHLPRLWRSYRRLRSALLEERPDVAVFVDAPDLNLPLAGVARRAGIPVLYYIAPQVWAWRYGRVRALRERVDQVAVIFPFEEALLRDAGVPAEFVGHPLAERMDDLRAGLKREEVARDLGLDLGRPLLGLLPGSRTNEIARDLPLMLETARLLYRAMPTLQIALLLGARREIPAGVSLPGYVKHVRGRTHEGMAIANALLAAPGTVTVEAALLGTPLVVTHRLQRLSFEIARRLTRVPSTCMVNLVAGAGVVTERIQQQARPAALAAELARLLGEPEVQSEARRALSAAVEPLRQRGAAQRTAERVIQIARRAR